MRIKLAVLIFLLLVGQAYASSSSANFSLQGGLSSSGKIIGSSNSNLNIIEEDHEVLLQTSNSYRLVSGFRSLFQIARLGPILTSIDPNSGLNTSTIHINKISGANFAANPSVKLTYTGETDLTATNVLVTGANQIACDFNLAGAKAGFWNVVVTSNSQTATLPSGFEVKAYTFPSSQVLNSPNPFDPAREPTSIMYQLPQDTNVSVYIYSTTGVLLWKKTYIAGSEGGRSGQNTILWNGVSDFSEMAVNGVYLVRVIDQSGKTLAKGNVAVIRR